MEATFTPKVVLVFAEVKSYLLSKYYKEPTDQVIPTAHLREAIMATRGSDKRTIKKWIENFHHMGLIKPVLPNTWKIMS